LLLASVSEADPGRNGGRNRGGICGELAHERGHMRLFSWLPGGLPRAKSGANRAKRRWFSPAGTDLRRTLRSEGRRPHSHLTGSPDQRNTPKVVPHIDALI